MNKDYTRYKIENELSEHEIETVRPLLNNLILDSDLPPLPAESEQALWEQIEAVNKKYDKKQKQIRILRITAYVAASICLLLILKWYPQPVAKQDTNYQAIIASAKQMETPSENVQLVLSENRKLTIDGKESQVEYKEDGDVKVNSEKVDITGKEEQNETFNQLIVPLGKRSSVTFSDGTKIWVNSGSRVIYPVTFAKDKREIFVEGEIFLNVSHDKQKPFIVKTRQMNIKVLGTEFNVSAYDSDLCQQVVLVSGKVEVNLEGKDPNILKPNQMFHYDNQTNRHEVGNIDVNDYVAWKDGYYQFHQQPLNIVFKKLARYYGKTISWDKAINELNCSGKLDLKEDLNEVLNTLSQAAPIEINKKNENIQINVKP